MPFIGNQPALSYTSFAKQDFTTSATTSYTLDHPVTNENEIALFINFVRQEPTTAYTATNTTLTLTSATSASDDMYCVFLGKAVQTVNPPNGSVGLSQLSATGTKDATTFLRGDNTFAVAGGDNTPAFEAYLSSAQNVSQTTNTKIQFNTEVFDTANAYDNSTNYRFQPQIAGKYFVYASVNCGSDSNADNNKMDIANIFFKKNGSDTGHSQRFSTYTQKIMERMVASPSGIITLNGSSDYIEAYAYLRSNTQATLFTDTGIRSFFGAYKIIE